MEGVASGCEFTSIQVIDYEKMLGFLLSLESLYVYSGSNIINSWQNSPS